MKNNKSTKEINRKGFKEVLDRAAEIAKKETNQKIHMDLEVAAMDMLDAKRISNLTVVNNINNAIKKCKKQEVIMSLEVLVLEAYALAC